MNMKMKKAVLGVLAAVFLLSIGVTSAFASSPEYGQNFKDANNDGARDYAGNGYRYTDVDNDEIYNNRGAHCRNRQGKNYTDQNGDGICDNAGKGCQFADEDGDGVCDHYTSRPENGRGRRCHGAYNR